MQVNLEIQSTTTANKKKTKNVTYVNPEATNAQLKGLAQALNDLTTNTYTDAMRVEESSVDKSGGVKPVPSLTVNGEGNVTYSGDGQLAVYINPTEGIQYIYGGIRNLDSTPEIVAMIPGQSTQLNSFTGIISATETENYAATSTTFTVGG